MNIAVVAYTFPEISQTFVTDHVQNLVENGHAVHVYAWRSNPDAEHLTKKIGVFNRTYMTPIAQSRIARTGLAVKQFVSLLLHSPRIALACINVLRYGKNAFNLSLLHEVSFFRKIFDKHEIVHCHFATTGWYAAFAKARESKAKLIVTIHGHDINRPPARFGAKPYLNMFTQAEKIIVNSHFTMMKTLSHNCPLGKIAMIPMGIDLRKFCSQAIPIESDAIILLTVGRLVEKKGIKYSLMAVSKLAALGHKIKYRIIGDGPEQRALEVLTAKLGISNSVEFLGPRRPEELSLEYRRAHIFVLSSVTARDGDKEGQGVVLLEAQASGLPVVATNHNGFPDSLIDGRTGFLVPEKDVEALAGAIGELISARDQWEDIGLAGRRFVEQNFELRMLQSRVQEVYQSI